jgi:hypothetical protein
MSSDEQPKGVLPLGFGVARTVDSPVNTATHLAYREMQESILILEKALTEIPVRHGMGHNQPPESLKIESTDIDELTHAIQVLKEQPELPPDKGEAARKAVTSIENQAFKLREWAERRGEEFASEAAKAAGKQLGTWLPGTFVIWLVDQMLGLSHLAHVWLKALAAAQ